MTRRRTGRARRRAACRPCSCRSPANAGPAARATAVSMERLEGFGRAVLSAVDALDTAPERVPGDADGPRAGSARRCPRGSLRLLVLHAAAAAAGRGRSTGSRARAAAAAAGRALDAVDAQLRAAVPQLRAARLAARHGSGCSARRPSGPVPAGGAAVRRDGRRRPSWRVVLTFALAWLLWGAARCGASAASARPDPEVGGPVDAAGAARAGAARVAGQPADRAAGCCRPLHLWLALALAGRSGSAGAAPRRLARAGRARRAAARAADRSSTRASSGSGPARWRGWRVLLLAGGHVGLARRAPVERRARLRWPPPRCSRWAAAGVRVGVPSGDARSRSRSAGRMSYAGPGSLGGTESALRR